MKELPVSRVGIEYISPISKITLEDNSKCPTRKLTIKPADSPMGGIVFAITGESHSGSVIATRREAVEISKALNNMLGGNKND